MGSITNFLEDELLDHVFNVAYTPPAAVYVALCVSDPGEGATNLAGVECADSGNYAREAITLLAAAAREVVQSGALTFNLASGPWGTVTHWALCTDSAHNGGACMAYGALNESKAVVSGTTPSIADASINVTLVANEVSNYLANIMLDFAFRNQAFAIPDTFLAAIITNPVTDSMTGSTITEPAGGSYARKEVDVNGGVPPVWDLASSQLVDNAGEVAFATASALWGTIIAIAICDAVTLGNLLFYDNTMADQEVGNGDTMKFPAGDLDITLD